MRCTHQYRHSIKECPREAEELGLCIFHLPFSGKNFEEAELSGEDLEEAYLSGANLRGANLSNVNLRYADVSEGNLSGANLEWASLVGVDLSSAKLDGANLTNADIRNADLTGANLDEATLSFANLEGTSLIRASLNGAELYGASLNGTNLLGADFRGARLYGAEFDGAKNVEHAIFDDIAVEEKEGDEFRKKKDFERAYDSYSKALEVYLDLKRIFRTKGLYDRASVYSVGEWRVRGKLQLIASRVQNHSSTRFLPLTGGGKLGVVEGTLRYVTNRLYGITSLYGESPLRVLLTTVTIILAYALIFCVSGTIRVGSPRDCLYFSIVTFTTVGYGDITPVPSHRLLAASEAFIGAFMLSFFVVVMSRKLIR
ncbi:pentapeptide repeat-containing protein [Thermococcus henrietii]|uniref:pentapeptide repeat-containing protein n=1 Tax=Thermococcus henrietii TaxID=2016361 RepID=UPI000C07CA82|nr:pentapeptide repeat-containing protein [Thermococcus henrietii]